MSVQQVLEKILSDANAESAAIIQSAEEKAAKLLAERSLRVENVREETARDVKEKADSVLEKRAADARLECAKIMLREKRKVVDSVYKLALGQLLALNKEDSLHLAENLLSRYAESGDEVFFAENFKYAAEVEKLSVATEKKLKFSKTRLSLDGGMRLVGEKSDKDLSYGALLAADKDEHQAELAKTLFK